MNKVYKGYELIKEIAEGNITDKQQVYLLCAEKIKLYWEYGYLKIPASAKRENRKIDMFDIMNYEFEVEESTIDIDSIEEFELAGCNIKFNDTFIPTESIVNDMMLDKINKLVQAVKQLNKEIKELKEK